MANGDTQCPELRGTQSAIVPVIAGIRFADRMAAVFQEQRPQVVFHAAAHKHVPSMESNPGEAITNNVAGTRNLLAAAEASGVERFVMISTDKAVNPTAGEGEKGSGRGACHFRPGTGGRRPDRGGAAG